MCRSDFAIVWTMLLIEVLPSVCNIYCHCWGLTHARLCSRAEDFQYIGDQQPALGNLLEESNKLTAFRLCCMHWAYCSHHIHVNFMVSSNQLCKDTTGSGGMVITEVLVHSEQTRQSRAVCEHVVIGCATRKCMCQIVLFPILLPKQASIICKKNMTRITSYKHCVC